MMALPGFAVCCKYPSAMPCPSVFLSVRKPKVTPSRWRTGIGAATEVTGRESAATNKYEAKIGSLHRITTGLRCQDRCLRAVNLSGFGEAYV